MKFYFTILVVFFLANNSYAWWGLKSENKSKTSFKQDGLNHKIENIRLQENGRGNFSLKLSLRDKKAKFDLEKILRERESYHRILSNPGDSSKQLELLNQYWDFDEA